MKYDLSVKEERKKFIRYANSLLKKKKSLVALEDESGRTLNQNSYLHVLCRIMAQETGTSEEYAKQVYFKKLANPDLFLTVTKDPLMNEMVRVTRSTSELTQQEMSKAISSFIKWAAEQGYALPEATVNEDGSLTFKSEEDRKAFHQAQILTSRYNDSV